MTALPTRPLKKLAEINPRGTHTAPEELVSFVGMADLDEIAARTNPGTPRRFSEVAKGYTPFQNGDLLAAKITPCWQNGKVGEAALELEHGMGSTEFHVIRPGADADRRYLLHFLRTPRVRDTGTLRMTGSGGQRRVPTKYISDLAVPVPPLAEQRRIASILDEADAIRTKRRTQLAHLDELPQAIFRGMFSATIETRPFSELLTETRYGTSNKSSAHGTPTLRIPNVVNGSLDLTDMKNVPVSAGEYARLQLLDGDILFVRSNGNPENTGRCAVFDREAVLSEGFDPDRMIFASYLIRARIKCAHPIFVSAYMESPEGRLQLRDRAKTSAGQYNLNSTNLGTVMIPVAPPELQRAFANKIASVNVERGRVAKALDADEELFAALQHRAFRGEL